MTCSDDQHPSSVCILVFLITNYNIDSVYLYHIKMYIRSYVTSATISVYQYIVAALMQLG